MKSWIRLAIAIVVLCVLVGVLYWPKHQAAAPPLPPPLVKVSTADVQRIQIEPATGPTVDVQRDGDKWQLTQPYAAPADSAAVGELISTLGDITSAQDVGSGASPAVFGFDHPQQVILTVPGRQWDFQFGGDSPTGGNSYLRLGNDGAVKIVPSYIKQDSIENAFALQDKTVLQFPSDTLTGLELLYQGKKVELSRTNGAWPKDQAQNVQSLLDALHDGQMTSMVDPTGKAAAADGLAHTSTYVSLAWPNGTARLEIGNKKSPTEYYARNSSSPAIFTVTDSLVTNMMTVANPPKPPTVTGTPK